MNGNEPAQHPNLFDHENRITRLEEAVKYLQHTVEDGFHRMDRSFEAQMEQFKCMGERIKSLEARMDRIFEAMPQEFHRDRRFAAMVFLTTQLAVIGALLRLADIL